jgi:outer membrane protein assembly factor BamE (lipoprotein component of BamABCDE complex)
MESDEGGESLMAMVSIVVISDTSICCKTSEDTSYNDNQGTFCDLAEFNI